MSNKRELKRNINFVCKNLFIECMAATMDKTQAKIEDVNAIATSIVVLNTNYLSRISHPEPGLSPKKYYGDLRNQFNKNVIEIVDQIVNS
jgi:hypothetical protein